MLFTVLRLPQMTFSIGFIPWNITKSVSPAGFSNLPTLPLTRVYIVFVALANVKVEVFILTDTFL